MAPECTSSRDAATTLDLSTAPATLLDPTHSPRHLHFISADPRHSPQFASRFARFSPPTSLSPATSWLRGISWLRMSTAVRVGVPGIDRMSNHTAASDSG